MKIDRWTTFCGHLVAEGQEAHTGTRDIFERYRTRMTHEVEASSDEVMDDLRTIREQVVHELYP